MRFQITSETCQYYKVDYWGQLPATYEPQPENAARYIEARARNVRESFRRLPTAPISQLAAAFPGVDPDAFGRGLSPEHVSSVSVSVGGTHYVRECVTRTGNYAGLCDERILPSYSVSKSVFGGLALMRLAELFGEGVYHELVREWLPAEAGAAAGDWDAVTLRHCLDMATGNYQSAGYQVDEDENTGPFFAAEAFAGKAGASFAWPAREPPGRRHIYHTTDTFVLVSAMQRLLQAKLRAQNVSLLVAGRRIPEDIWQLLAEDVFEPLQLSEAALSSLRTYDAEAQPYGGYGLWFKRDDFAKVANWLRNGEGRVPLPTGGGTENTVQVVDPAALRGALQMEGSNRGLDPNHPSLSLRYNYGFWAQVFDGPSFGCGDGESYYQPYTSGYGGIRMVLLGNGATYNYVSDDGEAPPLAGPVQESRAFGPLC